MIAINALATRAGGAAVRLSQVARRAPELWGTPILLLRNEGVGIDVPGAADRVVTGWPRILAHAPPVPRRVFEAAVLRARCRGLPVRALLHYGTYVPLRPARGMLNVLCFVSLAPWDPGPDAGSLRNRTLRRLFERSRYRADLVIVQSYASAAFLAKRYPDLAGNIEVLENGLSVPALVRPARPRGFLVVGDVYGYRRIPEVVRAYAELDPQLRSAHPLLLAGNDARDPAATAELERAVHAAGVASDVRRLGLLPRDVALQHMAEAAAYVSYAAVENGPNALREARAAGTPLILSDLPVHREFGGPDACYVEGSDALTAAFRGAAAAARNGSEPQARPAVDTWDEHVVRLGEILARHGALPAAPAHA